MTAFLRVDQDGLPEGEPGRSRTDGKADGSLVTLTDTSVGGTTEFHLLWTPPGDSGARSSLGSSGDPKVATFAPTAGKYGSYLVEMVRNPGLQSETRERRVIAMRTPNLGLVIPALNERGSKTASLDSTSGDVDNNATDFGDTDLNDLAFASWWRALHELIVAVDAGGGGGGGITPAVSLRYAFSTVTTDADPGAETVRVNAGGTALLVNPGDASGADWSAFFDDLARGYVRVETLDGAAWSLFAITGVETDAGYYRLLVTSVQSNDVPFTDGVALRLTFDAAQAGRGAIASITGDTTSETLESVVAALVAAGLATDDR